MATATELTTITPENSALTLTVDESKLAMIESIATECRALAMSAAQPMVRAFKTAKAIKILRNVLEEMKDDIMLLQGTKLGFRADKKYPWEVVREKVIEATVVGAHWTGNEMNIIADSMYLTKEFFQRALAEFPGLADLSLMPGIPQTGGDWARVAYTATWTLFGKPDSMDCIERKMPDGTTIDHRIPVRVNSAMGMDAILGKAERKMRARIMARISGSPSSYPEGDPDDAIPTTAAPIASLDQLAAKIGNKPAETRADEGTMLTLEARIKETETAAALKQLGDDIKAVKMADDQRAMLREAFAARQKELGK